MFLSNQPPRYQSGGCPWKKQIPLTPQLMNKLGVEFITRNMFLWKSSDDNSCVQLKTRTASWMGSNPTEVVFLSWQRFIEIQRSTFLVAKVWPRMSPAIVTNPNRPPPAAFGGSPHRRHAPELPPARSPVRFPNSWFPLALRPPQKGHLQKNRHPCSKLTACCMVLGQANGLASVWCPFKSLPEKVLNEYPTSLEVADLETIPGGTGCGCAKTCPSWAKPSSLRETTAYEQVNQKKVNHSRVKSFTVHEKSSSFRRSTFA